MIQFPKRGTSFTAAADAVIEGAGGIKGYHRAAVQQKGKPMQGRTVKRGSASEKQKGTYNTEKSAKTVRGCRPKAQRVILNIWRICVPVLLRAGRIVGRMQIIGI